MGSDSGDTQAGECPGQASGDLSPQATQKSTFFRAFISQAKGARVKNNRLTLAATCAGQPHPTPPLGTAAAPQAPPGTFWEHFLLLLLTLRVGVEGILQILAL